MVDSTSTHTMILDVEAAQMQRSLDAAERELGQLTKEFDRAAAASKKFTGAAANTNRAVKGMTGSFRNTQNIAQQAGYQFSDFFVQIEGGTSVTRAFSQQFSQLAPLFGPIGIGLGVAVPLVAALGPAFLEAAFGAKEAEEDIKRLSEALENAAKQTKGLRLETRQLNFGVSSEELALIDKYTEQMKIAAGYQEQADSAARNGVKIWQDKADAARALAEETREQLRALQDANAERDRAADYARELSDAERLVGQAMSDAADQAARLKGETILARDAAMQAAREFLTLQTLRSRFAGEEIVMGQDVVQVGRGDPPGKVTKPNKGGGADQAVKDAERVAEALRKAQEQAEMFGGAMEESFGALGTSAIDQFVDGLVDGELAFKDFAAGILRDMAKMIIRAAILNALMAAFGGTPGNPANATQGIIQAMNGITPVTPFAKGGVVNAPTAFPMTGGRTGLMGEAGPEAIVPLQRTPSGDLGVGASPVNIQITNNSDANISARQDAEGIIQIAVERARAATLSDFMQSMAVGQGGYARSMEGSYNTQRKAT